MGTNQKLVGLRSTFVTFSLLINLVLNGQQGEIVSITSNGKTIENPTIIVAPPNGKPDNLNIRARKDNQKGTIIKHGSIIEVPADYSITLESSNTNQLTINGPKIIEYLVTPNSENFRILDQSEAGFLNIKVFKDLLGNVTSSNITGDIDGSADFTEWNVFNDGDNIKFEWKKGQVTIRGRTRIKMDDNVILEDSVMRTLFLTEKLAEINPKNTTADINSGNLPLEQLDSEEEIDSFFNKQFSKQKNYLKYSGPFSKKGYKFFDTGNYSSGIIQYRNALEAGEIKIDRFIQAALILVENYINQKELKNRDIWLDAAIEFLQEKESRDQEKFDQSVGFDTKIGAKAFGNDLISTNEYFAWAFTVKLRLNGCLEHEDQNPIRFIKRASEIKTQIKDY